jgi:hypothetical protein
MRASWIVRLSDTVLSGNALSGSNGYEFADTGLQNYGWVYDKLNVYWGRGVGRGRGSTSRKILAV